jgi:hypothetical protein
MAAPEFCALHLRHQLTLWRVGDHSRPRANGCRTCSAILAKAFPILHHSIAQSASATREMLANLTRPTLVALRIARRFVGLIVWYFNIRRVSRLDGAAWSRRLLTGSDRKPAILWPFGSCPRESFLRPSVYARPLSRRKASADHRSNGHLAQDHRNFSPRTPLNFFLRFLTQ